ncbi:MAG: aldose 1-epimerase family protein [Clostridiales bacterium]|nr:aldose 1-epimerase family protein [Clostridiales bacterium]
MNKLSRQEILRRCGNPAQLANVRRFTYADGNSKGMGGCEVKTGSGLRFTVLEDRGFDLYEMEYKGVNLSWLSKPSLVSGERFSSSDGRFGTIINGGMMFTAGLLNAGGGCNDNGKILPVHGTADGQSATEIYSKTVLRDGGYDIEVGGKIKEASLNGENLEFTRKYITASCKPSVTIKDRLDNLACEDCEFMLLYHINIGYPMLDEGSKLYTSKGSAKPRNKDAAPGFPEHRNFIAPVDGLPEEVFFHDLQPDKDGYAYALLVNEKLELGLYVKYSRDTLENLNEWKHMHSGDYVLGLEPANCFIMGRVGERENGSLKTVKAFSSVDFEVEIGILDGADKIDAFIAEKELI